MGLFDVLGDIIKQVANNNETNENVKTANPVVFQELERKFETVEKIDNTGVASGRSRGDLFKDYYEKVQEAQQENEASQEVETADASVYDDLMNEIEKLKQQVATQNTHGSVPDPISYEAPTTSIGSQAMTNSMGGSLQIRTAPNMGAPSTNVRIPDETLIKVLEYSDNSIMLDGRKSRFVLIDFNGQQGWVLENYLNFN